MSLREEIARTLFKRRWPDYDFDEHLRMYEAGQAVHPKAYNDTTIGNAYADRDALMPLVERAVREAAIAGWAAGVFCERGDKDYKTTDEIVARVMESGR